MIRINIFYRSGVNTMIVIGILYNAAWYKAQLHKNESPKILNFGLEVSIKAVVTTD